MMTLFLTGLIVAIVTGNFWTLAIVFLIPQRIGLTVLAWWFDWLPHHGLEDTQRSNRYRATRNRVGAEWLFTRCCCRRTTTWCTTCTRRCRSTGTCAPGGATRRRIWNATPRSPRSLASN